MSILKKY